MPTEPRVHELKIWPEPFAAVRAGRKRCEIREDDRDFSVGDHLLLREWIPPEQAHGDRARELNAAGYAGYTGFSVPALVTHVERGWGIPADLCVMSIRSDVVLYDPRKEENVAEQSPPRAGSPAPARGLTQAIEALNEEIARVEDDLRERGHRARASVPLPSGGELAWGKVDGKWHLTSVADSGQESALAHTSVRRRAEGAAHVGALAAALADAARDQVAEVQTALSRLRATRLALAADNTPAPAAPTRDLRAQVADPDVTPELAVAAGDLELAGRTAALARDLHAQITDPAEVARAVRACAPGALESELLELADLVAAGDFDEVARWFCALPPRGGIREASQKHVASALIANWRRVPKALPLAKLLDRAYHTSKAPPAP